MFRGHGQYKRKITNKNIFSDSLMLNEVLKIYEKMICVDVRRANAKQQETKELVDVGILPIFTRSIYLKNLKWNRKMACIFYLILVVIFHPVWYCPFKNRVGGFFYLMGKTY